MISHENKAVMLKYTSTLNFNTVSRKILISFSIKRWIGASSNLRDGDKQIDIHTFKI